MPRRPRINIQGFHHVINRGVNREPVFLCDKDKYRFIQILDTVRDIYRLTIHSFCVLDNHYHLLLETHQDNLSLAVRYINSQYAIFFNKKMERIGPLWQGRFKSWYVDNETYSRLVLRYIEMNPVKAGLASAIGEYPFSSSYYIRHDRDTALLAGSMILKKGPQRWLFPLDEQESETLSEFQKNKFEKSESGLVQKKAVPLTAYFDVADKQARNASILRAFLDGYKQSEIASHLELSTVAVSRIVGCERAKRELFNRMKNKGLFWSYAADSEYDTGAAELLIEIVLKYADMDELKTLVELFGIRKIKQVWEKSVKDDVRFKRLNYFLARVLFGLKVEANEFAGRKNSRAEKLRLLAG